MQEFYLWALSRPRDSLPTIAGKDGEAADAAGGKVSVPVEATDGKVAKDVSDAIHAARGLAHLMNGTADRNYDGGAHVIADGIADGKPLAWMAPFRKQKQPGLDGARQKDSPNSSWRGVKGDSSGHSARLGGRMSIRASHDSGAHPYNEFLLSLCTAHSGVVSV